MGDEKILTELGLDWNGLCDSWMSLSPHQRIGLIHPFKLLHSKSLLDNEVVFILLRNIHYSSWLVNLILKLHDTGIEYHDHLQLIGSAACIAPRVEAIIVKLIDYGLKDNSSRITDLLSIQEADAIDAFIELLHGSGRLTEARLDALLKKRNFPVGAYVSSLKVLSKWYLCTDSNETLLQSVDSDNLNDISLSLVTIDEFGQKLSQELLEALVKYQSDCKAIYTGLSFLQSRIKLFTPAQAMTIITAGNAANSVSGNLVFLIQSGLDSRENCDSLLRTKDCAKSIEIILYQLKCKMAITQDNFNRVIEVAHLLADPVVMGRLTHISWSSPLTLPRIDALLSTLSTFSSCTTDAERDDLLATCATIIDPGLARGGNLSASSTLLYKMSPIL